MLPCSQRHAYILTLTCMQDLLEDDVEDLLKDALTLLAPKDSAFQALADKVCCCELSSRLAVL